MQQMQQRQPLKKESDHFIRPILRDVKKNNVSEVSQSQRLEMKINFKELQIKVKNPESLYKPMSLKQIERDALIKGKQEIKQLYKQTSVQPCKVKFDSFMSQEGDDQSALEEIQGKNKCHKSMKSASRKSKINNNESSFEDKLMTKGVKKNQCPYRSCMKIFRHSTSLSHHIKTHTGEKPYICRFCSKTFITNGNKKDHERRHLNLKLFQCDYCGEKFHRSNQLKTHKTQTCRQLNENQLKQIDLKSQKSLQDILRGFERPQDFQIKH